MRLVCPNCSAQYEVDPAMIPAEGRDVQCSNCAHTWFQVRIDPEQDVAEHPSKSAQPEEPSMAQTPPGDHGGSDVSQRFEECAAAGPELTAAQTYPEEQGEQPKHARSIDEPTAATIDKELPDETTIDQTDRLRAAMDQSQDAPGAAEPPDEIDPESFAASVRDAITVEDPQVDGATGTGQDVEPIDVDETDRHADGATPPAAPSPAAALASEAADILREEAEREVSARRGVAPSLEHQGDLALEASEPSSVQKERLARMRGEVAPAPGIPRPEAATPFATGSRRELLPDIEEIKSSLRPGEAADGSEPSLPLHEVKALRKRGFRTGFGAVVAASVLLVAGYAYAPQLSRAFPAFEPAIIGYVEIANSARDGIDGLLARSVDSLNGVSGPGG